MNNDIRSSYLPKFGSSTFFIDDHVTFNFWHFQVAEKWLRLSDVIRRESTKVYSKMRSLFTLPAGKNFVDTFEAEVRKYQEATKDYSSEKLLYLVKDPIA